MKTVMIDTNVILNDYTTVFSMKNTHILIPQMVITELDKKKNSIDNRAIAYNARQFTRKLKALMRDSGCEIDLANGSRLTLLPSNYSNTLQDLEHLQLEPTKADNIIVATAWRASQSCDDFSMITGDANMWLTCKSIGLNVEDHETADVKESQGMYTGVKTIMLEDSELIERIYSDTKVYLEEEEYPGLFPNQILVFKSEFSRHSSAIVMFNAYNLPLKRIKDSKNYQFAGIKPLNKEQTFAFELLSNDRVSCVTLAGRAGTGKSMVALSFGIEGIDREAFDKIIILKPIVPVGRDVGFLPGTLEEKLGPWMESFRDSLDIIFAANGEKNNSKDDRSFDQDKSYDFLVESGMLEFLPLTFMRGRSIQRSLIILDEAQNTSIHEMKTLLTRIGEGSKIILLGDIDQIDAPWLNAQNNGLSYLIEKGAETELVGHITLIKSLRSPLADWASSNL
jgi:PhoH-like ATPase